MEDGLNIFGSDIHNDISVDRDIVSWFDKIAQNTMSEYAIIGSYALHQYIPDKVKYNDIDVMVRMMDKRRIRNWFDVSDVVYNKVNNFRINVPFINNYLDIKFFEVDSLLWIVEEAVPMFEDRDSGRFATKEGLLYLYLMSTDDKHVEHINLLLDETDVNVVYVFEKLKLYDRYKSIDKLETILKDKGIYYETI